MCTPTSLLFVNSDCWRARNAVFNFYSPYYVKAKLKRPTKPIPARFRLDHAHTTDTASVLQGVLRDLCWSWKHAKGKVTWEGQEMQLMLYQLNHNRTIIITNPISSPGYFVNSTDEGPGPKRLEKNSNQNTALLFIIFLFSCWTFPYYLFLYVTSGEFWKRVSLSCTVQYKLKSSVHASLIQNFIMNVVVIIINYYYYYCYYWY